MLLDRTPFGSRAGIRRDEPAGGGPPVPPSGSLRSPALRSTAAGQDKDSAPRRREGVRRPPQRRLATLARLRLRWLRWRFGSSFALRAGGGSPPPPSPAACAPPRVSSSLRRRAGGAGARPPLACPPPPPSGQYFGSPGRSSSAKLSHAAPAAKDRSPGFAGRAQSIDIHAAIKHRPTENDIRNKPSSKHRTAKSNRLTDFNPLKAAQPAAAKPAWVPSATAAPLRFGA